MIKPPIGTTYISKARWVEETAEAEDPASAMKQVLERHSGWLWWERPKVKIIA